MWFLMLLDGGDGRVLGYAVRDPTYVAQSREIVSALGDKDGEEVG